MAKKIRTILKVQAPAGKATAAPPVGPALGQHGINIMEFIKAFNERTATMRGYVVPAEITVFEDRSFSFVTKAPLAAALLKRAAGVETGSAEPNRDKVGRVSRDAAARDRRDEDGRPERQRRRAGDADHRGHRPQHGHRGGIADGRPRTEVPRGGEAGRGRSSATRSAEAAELLPQLSHHASSTRPSRLHLRLGVDPRHADQLVRGTVVLPHGTGSTTRVIVFAQGEKAQEALRAGADEVGGEDLVKQHRRRLVRVRRRHRHAGHDGHGRPAREEARPARPDAEPEVGHRDLRHRARGERDQVRPDRVQGRSGRDRARAGRPRQLHARSSCAANVATLVDAVQPRQADRVPRAPTCARSPWRRPWAPACASTSRPRWPPPTPRHRLPTQPPGYDRHIPTEEAKDSDAPGCKPRANRRPTEAGGTPRHEIDSTDDGPRALTRARDRFHVQEVRRQDRCRPMRNARRSAELAELLRSQLGDGRGRLSGPEGLRDAVGAKDAARERRAAARRQESPAEDRRRRGGPARAQAVAGRPDRAGHDLRRRGRRWPRRCRTPSARIAGGHRPGRPARRRRRSTPRSCPALAQPAAAARCCSASWPAAWPVAAERDGRRAGGQPPQPRRRAQRRGRPEATDRRVPADRPPTTRKENRYDDGNQDPGQGPDPRGDRRR